MGDAALLAVAAAVGDPFAPFVVGEDRRGDEDGDRDGEEEFHGVISSEWALRSATWARTEQEYHSAVDEWLGGEAELEAHGLTSNVLRLPISGTFYCALFFQILGRLE
jgi:hypothetical protein